MTSSSVRILAAPTDAGEEYFVDPVKLIRGNPRQTAWVQYTDPSGKFFAGFWASETGKWRISYTEQEYCSILEGVSVITDDQGVAVTVRPGDEFVIPRGFNGTWEVVEATRKRFVIHEPGA